MKISLLTPKGAVYSGEALSATLPALKGPTYIGEKTTPIMLTLDEAGVMEVEGKDGKRYYAVFGGEAVNQGGALKVYSPLIEPGDQIDAARAQASKDRAEKRLKENQAGVDIKRAQASLRRALARLDVKQRDGGKA